LIRCKKCCGSAPASAGATPAVDESEELESSVNEWFSVVAILISYEGPGKLDAGIRVRKNSYALATPAQVVAPERPGRIT
jgi:hypothetical protein